MSKSRILGGLIGASALAAAVLIMPHEGKVNTAYLDPPGIPTICYGHTSGVRLGQMASNDDCMAMLEADIKIVDAALTKLIKVSISEKTRAAFISFTFNIGQGQFSRSTSLMKLNSGDIVGSCNEMLRWVYSKGKALPGLQIRREAERKLCLEGTI